MDIFVIFLALVLAIGLYTYVFLISIANVID